jgi:hypothetical protein
MKAGYEHEHYFVKVESHESGAGFGTQGYHVANFNPASGAILMLKKRRVFLPENKASPKFLAWMRKLMGERAW